MTILEFVGKYKSGDIIYPSAVARNCGITMKEAYQELENLVDKIISRVYQIRCPKCNHYMGMRYYSLSDIPEDYCCSNCDIEFDIDQGRDVIVLYEKN